MNFEKNLKYKTSKILIESLNEGLALLKERESQIELKNSMFFISDYNCYKLGEIKHFESGIIKFEEKKKFKYESVIDYKKDAEKLPSWSEYHELIKNHEYFKKYYDLSEFGVNVRREFLLHLHSIHTIQKLLDSYVYLNNEKIDVNHDILQKVIDEHINSIFQEKIKYDVWIPIIYTKFECENYKLSKDVSIKEIPKDLHIARNAWIDEFKYSRKNKLVIQGCSHAIVLKNFEVSNSNSNNWNYSFNNLVKSDEFKNKLDHVFGSLNIISKIDLYYNQLFAHSTTYMSGRYANIPEVLTTYSEEDNPDHLADHGWQLKPDNITKTHLDRTQTFIQKATSINSAKIAFATRKLILAGRRKNKEDSLLDATIGLESILSNDSKSEITYRLSMRGAFICNLKNLYDFTPSDIKDFLKKIYAYRSAIVHGNKKSDKLKKSVIIYKDYTIDCCDLAIGLLRHFLEFFVLNPQYLDLKALENKILDN